MRGRQGDDAGAPIPGYDRMSPKEISDGLNARSQVDLAAIEAYERAHEGRPVVLDQAVRDYERKFQHRREVLDETARVLPQAPANPEETRAREAKTDAVRRAMRSEGSPGQPNP